jgi:hypothetical protein
MGSMYKAKVHIFGTRPLLFHCFTPDTLSLEKKVRTGVAGNDPEEWKRTYTATKDGQLYLSPRYCFGCLRNGAKYTKKGKATYQGDLSATLQIQDERVLLNRFMPDDLRLSNDESSDVFLDTAIVRNPTTKGRNVRYRVGVSKGWEAEFNILWDATIIPAHCMESICIDSGSLVGLGDGRSIGYGRFEVIKFDWSENNAQEQTA